MSLEDFSMDDDGEDEPDRDADGYLANYRLKTKWGPSVLQLGFAAIPTILLRVNAIAPEDRRIKSAEMCVLLIIVSYWWHAHQPPFPGIKKIAREANISDRQVKRIIESLKKKGYLTVVKGRGAGSGTTPTIHTALSSGSMRSQDMSFTSGSLFRIDRPAIKLSKHTPV